MSAKKNTIDHRRRKNDGSAEAYAEERTARNAARGRQVWVWDNEKKKLGHWERQNEL